MRFPSFVLNFCEQRSDAKRFQLYRLDDAFAISKLLQSITPFETFDRLPSLS
jgi:hypothetical protein